MLEWRNWQTHGTQNPASFTRYEGSTPSSSTINSDAPGGLTACSNANRWKNSGILLRPGLKHSLIEFAFSIVIQ